MSQLESLRTDSAELELMSNLRHYSSLSARVGFGMGGVIHAEQLYTLLPSDEKLHLAHQPNLYAMTGWIALELAAYSQPESKQRRQLAQTAEHHFESSAKFQYSSNGYERLDSVRGRMGLITANAYASSIPSAINDTPGMYAEILDSVVNDSVMQSTDNSKRVGYISELLMGTVLSSLDVLVLPASYRHHNTISIEQPSFSHDLSMWAMQPNELPKKPDRLLQIKSRSYGNKLYSPAISVIETNPVFEGKLHKVACAFIRLYNGSHLAKHEIKTIKRARLQALDAIMPDPGDDDYQLRGSRMRNRTTGKSLVISPRLPID